MARVAVVLLLVLLLTSCVVEEQEPLVEAALDRPFVLEQGQSALIGSEDVLVTFVNVVEDSRCPSDVVCVWQGDVTVKLEVSFLGGESLEVELSDDQQVEDLVVDLLQVNPYPVSGEPIEHYTIELLVGKI